MHNIDDYIAQLEKVQTPETAGDAVLTLRTMIEADQVEHGELRSSLEETSTNLSDTKNQLLENQKQLLILGISKPGDNPHSAPPANEEVVSPKDLVAAMLGRETK